MMNILYLHVGAEMYGSDKVLYQLVTNIDKTKFTPFVVLPEHGKLEQALLEEHINVSVIPYPIMRRSFFSPYGVIRYVYQFLLSSRKLARFARGKKVKLIHVNTIAVLEGVYFKLFTKIPVLWHVHEILIKPRLIYKFTSFLIGHFSDKIVAISKATKRHLVQSKSLKSKDVSVIYNGLDFSKVSIGKNLRAELEIATTDLVVGHVGRVNAWKGQEDFLLACFPLLERNDHIHLILSGNAFRGEEWREKQLKELISKHSDISGRVHYLGYRSDMNAVFNTLDLFVSCSTRPEPFSMVTIEAMAHSCPVVAYDVGGPAEIVLNEVTGKLVKFREINALSQGISDLVLNDSLRTSMGKASEERVKKDFSMEQFISQFEALYQQCQKR